MKTLHFILLLCYFHVSFAVVYKLCVPRIWLSLCEEMVKEQTKTNVDIKCVAARDRVECLSFIQQRHADFTTVEPEDMYLARKIPNEDFYIFQEIRIPIDPTAEYRYMAAMVIRNSININSLKGLKGLKSCHTGVDRNVGYKIPLAILKNNSIIGPMDDLTLSPKENELKAFSELFQKSCIVGKWSPDPQMDRKLKQKYSNLCAMCEHPSACDYPDNFSGYDGSLRCLTENNGDIAFTKMIYVREHFKTTSADGYSYLCADGSKESVKGTPCVWIARPWQGVMGHRDILQNINPLRNKLRDLVEIGIKKKAQWLINVLTMYDELYHLHDNSPIRPEVYLDKSNYTFVIERGRTEQTEPVVRLCVTSDVAMAKCRTISLTAYSRNIRPKIECVQHNSDDDCVTMVRQDKADAASVAGYKVYPLMKETDLTPLFSETYINNTSQYAVAVVKKSSAYTSWTNLLHKRSCHKTYHTVEGFIAPVYSLIKNGFIKPNDCDRLKSFLNFFSSGSCIPDANDDQHYSNEHAFATKQCEPDIQKGMNNDPIKCLDDDRGDVAFVSNLDLVSLDASKYELLCLNKAEGGRSSLNDWQNCNLIKLPPTTWMGVPNRSKRPTDSISYVMLSVFQLGSKDRPDLIDIFGEYLQHNNVIFNSLATGLVASDRKLFTDFNDVMKTFNCA